jgi:hypothetical protein
MPEIPEKRIVAELTHGKRSVSDWFLVAGLPCYWDRFGDPAVRLYSDGALYAAIQAYLRRLGAPEYESFEAAERSRCR